MTVIGVFPWVKLSNPGSIELKPSKLLQQMDSELEMFFQVNSEDMVLTQSTIQTIDASIRKMDRQPCYDFENDKYYEVVISSFKNLWKDVLTTTHLSYSEILETIDFARSSGFVISQSGYKSKQDYVKAGGLSQLMLMKQPPKQPPLWKVAGKIEKKKRSDYIGNNKQRTFIIEPFETLFHRKRIFGRQNAAMKNIKWSAYGINPYEGGTHRLGARMNKYKYKMCWDAVRWDRLASWMKVAYDLRTDCVPPDGLLKWVVDADLKTYLVLPDGTVVYKNWGNNSGSGLTTCNNILGMSLVVIHALLIISDGDPRILDLECFDAALFGDDGISGLNTEKTQEEVEQAFRTAFKLYGVELDPFIISEDLDGLEFLGFIFKNHRGYWIPKYNLGTLCSSILFLTEEMDVETELNKILTLAFMSAGNGEYVYNKFKEVIFYIIHNYVTLTTQKLLDEGIPEYQDVINWYLGLESSSFDFSFYLNDFSD